MRNTRKTLKIFTCLNFSLIFALASAMPSEAMRKSPGGDGTPGRSSYFGTRKNPRGGRTFRSNNHGNQAQQIPPAMPQNFQSFPSGIQQPTPTTQQRNSSNREGCLPNPQDNPELFIFLPTPPVVARNFQINPSQMGSGPECGKFGPYEVADFILSNLDFVIPSMDDLLKYIPNIIMKGIMGQLLDQYGGKFPAHEMILSCLTQLSPSTPVINVLDYNNPTKYSTGAGAGGQYIDVQFTRILVRPVAYVLRSDFTSVQTDHLKTFTFSGKLPDGKWITLDEHVNFYPLARPTSMNIFFVNTKQYFQEFRLTQTGPSHAGHCGFSLAGFDIHGDVIKNS